MEKDKELSFNDLLYSDFFNAIIKGFEVSKTGIYTDEYLYYNPETDRLILQVFSQGMIGCYYIYDIDDDGLEIALYPKLEDNVDMTNWVFIDILQEREETINRNKELSRPRITHKL